MRVQNALPKAVLKRAQRLVVKFQSVRLAVQQLKSDGLLPENMHYTTVWRHLNEGSAAIKHTSVTNKPLITSKIAKKRRAFSRHHQRRTKWSKVLFVDSKYFYVSNKVSNKQWVPIDEVPTRQVVKHSPAVHVYAGFSASGVTPLIEVSGTTGHKFIVEGKLMKGVRGPEYQHVLKQHLIPAARQMFGRSKWQLLQDNAPPHRAASTAALLAQEGVQVVQHWPGNSPDLNPIENLWAWLAGRLSSKHITTLAQLRKELQLAWRAVPRALLQKLASSMTTRLALVKQNKGEYIGY
jgi:hypothetical protein